LQLLELLLGRLGVVDLVVLGRGLIFFVVGFLFDYDPHNWELLEERRRLLFYEHLALNVPGGAFQIQSIYVTRVVIFWTILNSWLNKVRDFQPVFE
jgi:hypothetical protein